MKCARVKTVESVNRLVMRRVRVNRSESFNFRASPKKVQVCSSRLPSGERRTRVHSWTAVLSPVKGNTRRVLKTSNCEREHEHWPAEWRTFRIYGEETAILVTRARILFSRTECRRDTPSPEICVFRGRRRSR